MFTFTNQVVLVTGASRGIGKAVTLRFLEHGATVIGVYGGNREAASRLREEADKGQERLHLYQCDVADGAQIDELFDEIDARMGQLEVLVNNAGIRRDNVLAMMSDEDWQRVLDVNLTGSFRMARAAVLLMMRKKYGRIINITSPVAQLGFAGQANYAASKAGQIAMTRSLAKETAKKKITVNCVSPGFIETDFLAGLTKDQLAGYKKMVPMRRFGTTREVADAVLFLASPEASYITGSVLEVNGGI